MKRLPWVVLCILLIPYGVSANDTAARVGVGGLVLEKNDDIEMASEVLEISQDRIRVTYHFRNTSDHDIKIAVAFPMPAYDYSPNIEYNQRPLDSFRIIVNGKEVIAQKSRAFLIDGVDVTDKLRKIGLSDDQIFNTGWECLGGDPDNAEIIKVCSLNEQKISDIKKLRGEDYRIQETAYWEQVFTAGREIEVVHEYHPFVGINDKGSDPEKDGCLDGGTKKLLERRFAEHEGAFNGLMGVEYILGTGRNWRGPIKHFKLIIKKKYPDDVVSLCFPGKPMKTSPTTIEFSQSDYVPQDKLIVYFYNF